MSSDTTKDRNKLWLLGSLGLLGVAVLGGALYLGVDVRGLIQRGLDLITQAGPLAFFGAMAVLPLFGVPLLAFVLTAGPAFAPQFGMPLVVFYSLCAVTFNLVVSYLLAKKALRPFLQGLVSRMGYKVPELEGGDAKDLLIILRVTPGVPFFVQNYMAGLSNVPLAPYLVISCIVAWAYNASFVVFGDALLHGKGKLVLISAGFLVALVAATHIVRRHYAAKKAAR